MVHKGKLDWTIGLFVFNLEPSVAVLPGSPSQRVDKENFSGSCRSCQPDRLCHNKLPQATWLKTTGIYSLPALSPGVQQQGVGPALSGGWPLPVSGGASSSCGHVTPGSASVFTRPLLFSLSPLPSLIRTLVIGLRAHQGNPG